MAHPAVHETTDSAWTSGREPEDVLAAFRRNALAAPDTPALVVGPTALTYGELDRVSSALARRLRELGARPGRVVCIRVEQSVTAVALMLAVLRTGAAWCVVEPDQPLSRLRALVQDTDCAVLAGREEDLALTGAAHPPALLDIGETDPVGRALESPQAAEGDDTPVSRHATAYVIYTSGSTGRPKAVAVSRAQLAASVGCRVGVYGDEPSVFFMAMRLSFDGMLGGLFWSFGHGHTLVLPDERRLRRPDELARLAARHGTTHLIVVPSYYRVLLHDSQALPPSLRLVVVAGEACTPELVRTHRGRLPGVRLVNEYGPTETTISCTVAPDPDPEAERVPIGRPWPGAVCRVLDERLREVPAGERGELYIGGEFVALGYAGQPARTAERFVADPMGAPGERVYRTGDVASRDASGVLHFHGRSDHQVKIRGVRIEQGEVEAVLEGHPGVAQSVVLHEEPAVIGPRLVAFLVPDGQAPGERELRDHCRSQLVEQAVPALFVPLERIPVTGNGKADRAALRDMIPAPHAAASAAGPALARDADAASGPAGLLRRVWAEVLGHDDTGPDESFFAVGGNSLRLVDLHRRLERQWPGVIRVAELFDLATIASQAAAIEGRLGPGTPADSGTVPKGYEL